MSRISQTWDDDDSSAVNVSTAGSLEAQVQEQSIAELAGLTALETDLKRSAKASDGLCEEPGEELRQLCSGNQIKHIHANQVRSLQHYSGI
ncbi:MAG: hypothetical protein FRX49_12595 [Trebouxia sp. A1-2]|nr:MAG: hypothetical protein FRX49_12595 [Trebouxia sp. A1-2]